MILTLAISILLNLIFMLSIFGFLRQSPKEIIKYKYPYVYKKHSIAKLREILEKIPPESAIGLTDPNGKTWGLASAGFKGVTLHDVIYKDNKRFFSKKPIRTLTWKSFAEEFGLKDESFIEIPESTYNQLLEDLQTLRNENQR